MSEMKRVGDLEVAEDMKAQRRNWRFQAVGSVFMVLLALAGLLGLLGGTGPLSRATAGNGGGPLSVTEYERFLRFGKPSTLEVRLEEAATGGAETRVWLDRDYVRGVEFQEIDPEPVSVETTPGRVYYELDAGSGGPVTATFELEPDEIGPLQGRMGLDDGGAPVSFGQFVYP